jgi:nickel-dependent lactate racemase
MQLPLGDGHVDVGFPDCSVTRLVPPGGTAVDAREAAAAAVDDPHGPPLTDVADPDDDVAVVVTDVTRATPDDVLLDVLLGELPVPRGQVTVVVGLGLHRPMTDAELREGLGAHADLAVNHDPDTAVEVGRVEAPVEGMSACPVTVHPAVAEADLVVSTGMVEPHQYAGFSGGAKTVVIGAGGEDLIRYTHGPAMLADPGVRLGRVDGNPFRETVDRAGDLAGPAFCVNVTKGPTGLLGASAGRPREVVADLAATARGALSVTVDREYDVVVAGVGAPKDANLYQTTRAFTYLVLGDRTPVARGGRVVVPARLEEGAGEGTGERRFYDRLTSAADAETLYEEMRAGYEPGAQRAFVVARALREAGLYVTDSDDPEVVEASLVRAAPTVADAVPPGSDVLVVPDALNTLVVGE